MALCVSDLRPQDRSSAGAKPWVYVIRIDKSDGTALHPVAISRAEPDWEQQLDEATEYFSSTYRGRGVVNVEYAANVHAAGVNDTESIVGWKAFLARVPWSSR